jgi:endonuclease YncB( thermonuclease family)
MAGGTQALMCRVNSIHDGDTLRVTCNGQREQLRLYCIDAPELDQRP